MIDDSLSHDYELQEKVNHACDVIDKVLEKYESPAVLCSFGKDSMLMLWMIRQWFTTDIPVVFFKLPYFQKKYTFAERIAGEWDLDLFSSIPSLGLSITSKNGKSELVNHYSIGQKQLLMPIGKQSIENAPRYLCAQEDLLKSPTGTFNWPWDVAFVGHKSSDSDPVQGDVPLQCDIHQTPASCDLAYPLRHFTDADVWKLTDKWNIPYNRLAYPVFGESSDIENPFNSDYAPYCSKCCDPNEADFVTCPKTELMVTNTWRSLTKVDPKMQYCGG